MSRRPECERCKRPVGSGGVSANRSGCALAAGRGRCAHRAGNSKSGLAGSQICEARPKDYQRRRELTDKMSTGLDQRGGSDLRVGTARDEWTDFRANPERLALTDPHEEALATTYRITLTGVEMEREPIQGFARGTCKRDALRRVDPSTIPTDLGDVDLVAMIAFGSMPTDEGP